MLIAGGYDKTTLKSAELFNAKTNTFEKLEGASHEMHEPREELAAVTLQDGKVLIVGGDDGGLRPATAELFNPKSNAFELVSAPLTQDARRRASRSCRMVAFSSQMAARRASAKRPGKSCR